MAKLPLDLKDFKKTASDKHTTTLKHKSGHEIKLAHSALSPEMREKLALLPMPKKMAEGGEVKEPKIGSDEEKRFLQSAMGRGEQHTVVPMTQTEAAKRLDQGLKYGGYAQGGEVEQIPADAANTPAGAPNAVPANAMPSQAPVTINIASPQPQSAPVIAPTPQQLQAPMQAPQAASADVSTPPVTNPEYIQHNVSARQAGVPQVQTPAIVPMHVPGILPQAPAAPAAPVDPAAAAQAQDPYGMGQMAQDSMNAVNQQKAGLIQEANALGQKGAAESKALEQQATVMQEAQQHYQNQFKALDTERQAFQQDLKESHIDPNHYFASLGTGGKIATVIGLIMGGMAVRSGRSNPAMDVLNKQIDRDIEAQKADLGRKENLLSANFKQFGNMKDAVDMTRIMQNDIVTNQLRDAAAKAANPLAQAAALKGIGILNEHSSQLQGGIARQRAMANTMSSIGNNTDKAVQLVQMKRMMGDESGAKALEEKIIPGVGVAQVPVPQSARDTIIAKQTLNKMAGEFYQWAEKHSGSVDPATVAEGQTKAAELQSLYRNSINGGVFKKGEQEFIDQIVDSDPTKFFNSVRVLPKLKEVINSNVSQLNTLKSGYGIPSEQIQFNKK